MRNCSHRRGFRRFLLLQPKRQSRRLESGPLVRIRLSPPAERPTEPKANPGERTLLGLIRLKNCYFGNNRRSWLLAESYFGMGAESSGRANCLALARSAAAFSFCPSFS